MIEPRWKSSHIQTLLFDARMWTPAQAVAWARSHGFAARKVHLTDHYVRVRQVDPTDGMPKRTFCLDRACHIKAILEAGPAPRASARPRADGGRSKGARGLASDARRVTRETGGSTASRTQASGRARRQMRHPVEPSKSSAQLKREIDGAFAAIFASGRPSLSRRARRT